MSALTLSRAAIRALACLTLAALACPLPAAPGTAGVLPATAGGAPSALEVAYLDALIADLPAATGLSAALLYESSPLVASRQVSLPAIEPGEDWAALEPILSRLAAELQLDYIIATALVPGDAGLTARLMIAVRGGGGSQFSFVTRADDLTGAADQMARRIADALAAGLPPPRDAEVEPVLVEPAVNPPAAPTAQPAPPTTPPAEQNQPAVTPPTAPTQPTGEQPATEQQPSPLAPALAAFERGAYQDALGLVMKAIQEGGATGEAYLLRARCHLALQDQDAAVEDLRAAVERSPELVEAQVRLARILADRGLWQESAEHYQTALEAQPAEREALLGLARLYRDHGHRQRAIDLLEGSEATATDAGATVLLGDLYAANGDDVAAQVAYLRAVALSDAEGKAATLEHLGDFYVKLRRHRDALTCYLQAAQLNPTRNSIVRRRYEEVMSAADSTVYDELTRSSQEFEAFVTDGNGERELVFASLSAARAQIEEALRFADGITPPDAVAARHARRQFAYSLAFEATVTALSFVDVGGAELRDRALARYKDALAEFEGLRQTP